MIRGFQIQEKRKKKKQMKKKSLQKYYYFQRLWGACWKGHDRVFIAVVWLWWKLNANCYIRAIDDGGTLWWQCCKHINFSFHLRPLNARSLDCLDMCKICYWLSDIYPISGSFFNAGFPSTDFRCICKEPWRLILILFPQPIANWFCLVS